VLLEQELPPAIERWAEFAVGIVIVALALRLLLRWERDNPRTPAESYGVGFVHGIGGSAGVGILLTGFGYALTRGSATRTFERLVPLLATLSLLFGAWYAASAL
jgi:hypothetical protein